MVRVVVHPTVVAEVVTILAVPVEEIIDPLALHTTSTLRKPTQPMARLATRQPGRILSSRSTGRQKAAMPIPLPNLMLRLQSRLPTIIPIMPRSLTPLLSIPSMLPTDLPTRLLLSTATLTQPLHLPRRLSGMVKGLPRSRPTALAGIEAAIVIVGALGRIQQDRQCGTATSMIQP